MANNNKQAKIERNISKVQEWNGESIETITDALDVIRANGGKYNLDNPKPIPDEFSDMADVEGIFAIDTEGNILYTDETTGTVQAIRDRRHREQIGLAPLDDLLDYVTNMRNSYDIHVAEESAQIQRKNKKTSANYRAYTEAVTILSLVEDKVNATADAMEAALTA